MSEDDDVIIHEDLVIEGSEVMDPRPNADGSEQRRWLTVGNGERSVEFEVQVTETALIKLGGRDVDDWIEEVIPRLAGSRNDGRKLDRLLEQAPIALHSDLVEL